MQDAGCPAGTLGHPVPTSDPELLRSMGKDLTAMDPYDWISFIKPDKHKSETVESYWNTEELIVYKVKQSIQEGFGGIIFDNLNFDDYSDLCRKGEFALLRKVKNFITSRDDNF